MEDGRGSRVLCVGDGDNCEAPFISATLIFRVALQQWA